MSQQIRENRAPAHVLDYSWVSREGDHARIIREGASCEDSVAGLRPRVYVIFADGGPDVLHGREDGEREYACGATYLQAFQALVWALAAPCAFSLLLLALIDAAGNG